MLLDVVCALCYNSAWKSRLQ